MTRSSRSRAQRAANPGVVTIAGTGSIAFGRNAAGETARAGGWGFLFGDEGSGFDIARQALRAALRFEEGWGPQTSLRRALLDFAGAADANELMHRLYTREWPKPRVAALAKLVETEALAGDAVARDILLNAAQQLATLAVSVRRRLFQSGEADHGVLHRRRVPDRHAAGALPPASGTGRWAPGARRRGTIRRLAHCWRPIAPPVCIPRCPIIRSLKP